MSKIESTKCEHCGSVITEYKFNLNKGLCHVLAKLYEAGGQSEIDKLGLTNSEYSNYPKLAYWDLAQRVIHRDEVKGGIWKITSHGIKFVAGVIPRRKSVVMRKRKWIRDAGDLVMFRDIIEGYDHRPFYTDQIKRQLGYREGELF